MTVRTLRAEATDAAAGAAHGAYAVAGWPGALRAAGIGMVCAALLYDVLSWIQQGVQPALDFASYYVPARAFAAFPSIDPYNIGVVQQLNAAHHYVSITFFPFIYPPAALTLLRPLTLFPFDTAVGIWNLISHASAILSAYLLADTFVTVVQRKAALAGAGGASWSERLGSVLDASSVRVGRWRIPVLPLGVTLAALLTSFPVDDTYAFGQVNLVVLVCIVVALHAHVHDRPVLAGIALAIAGALKLTPLVMLGFFLARRAWKTIASSLALSVVLAPIPLLMGTKHVYGGFLRSLKMVDSAFVPYAWNESLVAIGDHIATLAAPADASALRLTQLGAEGVTMALGVAVVGLLLLVSTQHGHVFAAPAPRTGRDLDLDWLGFAAVLAAYVLSTPVAWSHFYTVALPVVLMLAAYPLLRERAGRAQWTAADTTAVVCATVSFVVLAARLPQGVDHAGAQATGLLELALTAVRPVALLAACGVLCWGVAGFARGRRRPQGAAPAGKRAR